MNHQHSASYNILDSHNDCEKMEAATQRTASTYSSKAEENEDDNTTIKSMDDSNLLDSPALLGLSASLPDHHNIMQHGLLTPSTISTAASTDEASIENHHLRHHRRMPSWETHSLDGQGNVLSTFAGAQWGPSRVATFRETNENDRMGFPPTIPQENRWQQHPPRINSELPYLPNRLPENRPVFRQPVPTQGAAYNTFQATTTTQTQQQRRLAGYPPQNTQMNSTPPRPPRSMPPQQQPTPRHTNTSTPPPGGARSSAEVLKTLLRKKACLYEPDTSRAVALVTWLVGRELALEYGFFSRQQLQAGVHACVASKIDNGEITRTKVNRCMQIILNSCFHYIIPRPDGTEENGDAFRAVFVREMTDDSNLLADLPYPWNDIQISRLNVIESSIEELEKKGLKKPPNVDSTPPPSPRMTAQNSPGSPGASIGDDSDGKRAVLLCFNENVRSAEDVFRCHNEFIRDTAHASGLQLSSSEWRQFFGRKAADTPHLWGNIGIPVPFNEQHTGHVDALGMMTMRELGNFRTFWCAKRYDHDHTLCGFAHVEVNGGWLRRDPILYKYRNEMCQHVSVITGRNESDTFLLNACPHGINCEYCHSLEELHYNPHSYKRNLCSHLNGCRMADACGDFHPVETYRFPRKSDSRGGRVRTPSQDVSKSNPSLPEGSPVLFVGPAPLSSFERHLLMPGLQNLFRRQCAVVRESVQSGGNSNSYYSYFGDSTNIRNVPTKANTNPWSI